MPTVQDTADHAALSKLSACTLGYYSDPFIGELLTHPKVRRSPLLNRGYFARVAAFRQLVTTFVNTFDGKCQVVQLGAGSDTTYLWLKHHAQSNEETRMPLRWLEVDLADVVERKALALASSDLLANTVGLDAASRLAAKKDPSGGLRAADYRLVATDLRDVKRVEAALFDLTPPAAAVPSAASAVGTTSDARKDNKDSSNSSNDTALMGALDRELPTLFLSECVLVYIEPEESAATLAYLASQFPVAQCVTYEQIRPNDAFGQVMLHNMRERGCELKGVRGHQSTEEQVKRFTNCGWTKTFSSDMNDVYYKLLDRDDVVRAEKLEIFDEFEEWHLMQAHYAITVALNGQQIVDLGDPWRLPVKEEDGNVAATQVSASPPIAVAAAAGRTV